MAQCKAEFREGKDTYFCVLEPGHKDLHKIICGRCQGSGHLPRMDEDATNKSSTISVRESPKADTE